MLSSALVRRVRTAARELRPDRRARVSVLAGRTGDDEDRTAWPPGSTPSASSAIPRWDTSGGSARRPSARRLLAQCERKLGEASALDDLSIKAGIEHEVIHGAAALAAARAGVADPALTRAAAGAASMAAHGRALALLAEAGDTHMFVRKYALFEGGRWPLGIVRGAFHLF